MENLNLVSIIYIICLIIISAILSGSETSITSIRKSKIHKLANKGDRNALRVLKLIEKKNDLVSSILVGNNFVNILASALATAILIKFYGDDGVIYSTIVMSVLIVIFAEILPKNIALLKPDRYALTLSFILTLFLKIFSPFVYIIKKFNLLIFKIFNIEKQKVTDASVREDIRNIINMHEDEGILLKDERDMLNGILDLKEMTVEKIMTHRKNIYSINIDQPEEYFKKISQSSFSRIPVWKENPNNILGVVHAKKLLTNINESGKIDLKNINDSTLDPWFIPETTKVKDQLNAFIDRHEKIAFVVDEYGELMGLISLEDIIEEIVGNIFDESDLSTIGIRKIGKNIFRVRGDGEVGADGSISGGGVDYAEYFEWKDGNSSNEDRVGLTVKLDGNKIVLSSDSDNASDIIGVISGKPAVEGGAADLKWNSKFLVDDFNRYIWEEYTATVWTEVKTNSIGVKSENHIMYESDRIPSDVTVPSDAKVVSVDDKGAKLMRRKLNPDYDESKTYVPRRDREEWDAVGLLGQLRMKKGQKTGTNWIKMRDISDTVEEWLVR